MNVQQTAIVETELMQSHDKAAREACFWRTLQDEFAARRDELVPPEGHPDRQDALAAFGNVQTRLCMMEGAAEGTMVKIRAQLGRRPPRSRISR